MAPALDVFGPRSWVRPEATSFARLPMRTTFEAHPTLEGARSHDRSASPWWSSLDGEWDFVLAPRPEAVTDAHVAGADDVDWGTTVVPGCWTMDPGVDDEPVYTNVVMPWRCDPPEVPDENPTGVHRRQFSLPRGWAKRRTVLHVGGAESCLYVFCNGAPVGMGKDSRLSQEFDLTPHLRPGTNTLVLVVVRWSDGSWLEDQDHWWMAGLHREVFLRSTAPTRMDDVVVSAELADDLATGDCAVAVRVGGPVGLGWSVRASVFDRAGAEIASAEGPVDHFHRESLVAEMISAYVHPGPVSRLTMTVDDVEPWSSETPTRYDVAVTLVDPDGNDTEHVVIRAGFRRADIDSRELLLNGRPVFIRGVNRHDHDPDTGKTVSVESMRGDVVLMKQHNLNAVRCAHYPNDPAFLDACDELGLWVIDEANVETHARITSLVDDPRFSMAIFERIVRMVQRDRNHPSIFSFSLGNESGHGAVHDAAAAWIRRTEPSRVVHYEGACEHRIDVDPGSCTDLVCPMYPSIADIVTWAERTANTDEQRPLIMCEYSHAMGNSNGSLGDYWAAIETTPGLQGGFIWDWADQGLRRTADDGTDYFVGGQPFGPDDQNDGTFCCNGLVLPDRTPKPGLHEYAQLSAPIRFRARDLRRGRITVVNRLDWRDASWLEGRWTVRSDGAVVAEDSFVLPDLPPGFASTIDIPIVDAIAGATGEIHLDLSCVVAVEQPWAPVGHVVAWQQFELVGPADDRPVPVVPDVGGAARADGDELRAGPVTVRIDPAAAAITDLVVGGRSVLASPIEVSLWRAPTENDGRRITGERTGVLGAWLDLGLDRPRFEGVSAVLRTRRDGTATANLQRTVHLDGWPTAIRHTQKVVLQPGGTIVIDDDLRLPKALDDLPRIGLRWEVVADCEHLSWFGRGPTESYVDREHAESVGQWHSTVTEQYVPYVLPQEHGNHTDVRWMRLTDGDGFGMEVRGAGTHPTFGFTARHHHDADLFAATDEASLRQRDTIEVHLDVLQRGVGTGACGPDTLPPYRVAGGRARWQRIVRLLAP